MALDPENSFVTPQDINRVFEETISLSTEAEILRAQASVLDQQRYEKVKNLRRKVHETQLPDDAKIVAAALFRGAASAEEMQQDVVTMAEIDTKIKMARGQTALWFSTREVTTIHRFVGPNEYETQHFLHLGVLDNSASLQVGLLGELTVPLRKEIVVGMGKVPGHERLEHPMKAIWGVNKTADAVPHATDSLAINIEAPEGLQNFTLFAGDAEVEGALSQASPTIQPKLFELKDRLTSTLF